MTITETILIASDGIYDDALLCAALCVSAATLARACRDGRRRYIRQGKRTLYLSQWVLDWLQADVRQWVTDAS